MPPSRKPTYDSSLRWARLIYDLQSRPQGWSMSAIQNELGISKRTTYRYLQYLREEFVDERGRPLIEEVKRGRQLAIRFATRGKAVESSAYEVASFYFALTVFQFLEGTVLKDGVEGLWERFAKTARAGSSIKLEDFARKFYAVQFAAKDYREFDDILDFIVRALVKQRRLRIEYTAVQGEAKVHQFEPYTLAMYRGGLYLIGKSDLGRKPITLAVERINQLEMLEEAFEYPSTYTPRKYTEGAFGIINQPENSTAVELQLMNPATVGYVQARRLHPTQKIVPRKDGTAVLSLTVHGTDELRNWILGFGPHIKVLKPKALAQEVRQHHADAAALYQKN